MDSKILICYPSLSQAEESKVDIYQKIIKRKSRSGLTRSSKSKESTSYNLLQTGFSSRKITGKTNNLIYKKILKELDHVINALEINPTESFPHENVCLT